MITGNWGTVNGVFYPDGSTRDPSIRAALVGFFHNRGKSVLGKVSDCEDHLPEVMAKNKAWLAVPMPIGKLAWISPHLLEAAQLIPMSKLPSRQVILLPEGQPNMPFLRSIIADFTSLLGP